MQHMLVREVSFPPLFPSASVPLLLPSVSRQAVFLARLTGLTCVFGLQMLPCLSKSGHSPCVTSLILASVRRERGAGKYNPQHGDGLR